MFTYDQQTLVSFFPNLTEKEVDELFIRYAGFIDTTIRKEEQKGKSKKITSNLLKRGAYLILSDILKKKRRDMKKRVDYTGVRHPAILKYGDEIIRLKNEGKGAQMIANIIKATHNVKVSKNTVHNFLQQQLCIEYRDEIYKLYSELETDTYAMTKVLNEEFGISITQSSLYNFIKKQKSLKEKKNV